MVMMNNADPSITIGIRRRRDAAAGKRAKASKRLKRNSG